MSRRHGDVNCAPFAFGVTAYASVGERKHLLPENTLYIHIEDGDHQQFDSYKIDPKDHLATISRESQHEQIIAATLPILEVVSE